MVNLSIIVLVLAVCIGVLELPAVRRLFDQSLSAEEWMAIQRIGEEYAAKVEVLRDTYGVPHVYGETNAHTTFGLAYAHAEDDFTVIQQVILAGRGQLAAVYGKAMAGNDYMSHLFKVQRHVMERYEDDLAADTRAIAEGYAHGLNYYALLHQDEIVSSLLFPMHGRDIVAAFVHKIPLMFKMEAVLLQLLTGTEEPETMLRLRPIDMDMGAGGSNMVAVSPVRTANNSTLLSVNSHQPWDGHASWYEAHVHSSETGWDLTGCLLPGSPFPQMGHKKQLGWAFTVNRPDILDVYRLNVSDDGTQYLMDNEWHAFERVEAPIRVRIWGPIYITSTQIVEYSLHGAVIRGPTGVFAMRYATWGSIKYIEHGYRMAIAASFDEWKAGMSIDGRVPMFNANYADENGTIYYVWNAVIPKRDPKFDWLGVLPGTTSDALWNDGYESFDSLPQVLNPHSGFTQNCNNCPFFTTTGTDNPSRSQYPRTYGIEGEMTNRAQRYLQLLSGNANITLEEFIAYKWDMCYYSEGFVMTQIRRLIDWAAATAEVHTPIVAAAIDHLKAWDGCTDEANVHAAVAVGTIEPFIDVILWVVGPYPSEAIHDDIQPLVDKLIEVATALNSSFGTLSVPYGRVNRIKHGDADFGMGGGPDTIHCVHRKPVMSVDGLGPAGPIYHGWAGDGSAQIIEWSATGECNAWTIHQYGTALGRPESPHYSDQVELMATRQLRPVWRERHIIEQHLERSYHPPPPGSVSGATRE